jgi:hypothetical protein
VKLEWQWVSEKGRGKCTFLSSGYVEVMRCYACDRTVSWPSSSGVTVTLGCGSGSLKLRPSPGPLAVHQCIRWNVTDGKTEGLVDQPLLVPLCPPQKPTLTAVGSDAGPPRQEAGAWPPELWDLVSGVDTGSVIWHESKEAVDRAATDVLQTRLTSCSVVTSLCFRYKENNYLSASITERMSCMHTHATRSWCQSKIRLTWHQPEWA